MNSLSPQGLANFLITVNKRIKPVSRWTRAVRRNSLSHKSSEISYLQWRDQQDSSNLT